MDIFINLIKEIWHTFDEASLYILFGLILAGLIHATLKKDKIAKHLGERKFKPVLKAALFGIPLPLCSCGVIPTAISLRKSGASKGATLSFLISTPESGIDSIAIWLQNLEISASDEEMQEILTQVKAKSLEKRALLTEEDFRGITEKVVSTLGS